MTRKHWGLALALALVTGAVGLRTATTWRAGQAGEAAVAGGADSAAAASSPLAGGRAVASITGAIAAPAEASSSEREVADDVQALLATVSEETEFCGVGRISAAQVKGWWADPASAESWIKARDVEYQRRSELGMAQIAARLSAGGLAQQVAARALMGDAEGAAVLAEGSSDALAYQLASYACVGPGASASPLACKRLTAQRWLELDPTDARPWMRLLAEAERRRDEAAIDQAVAAVAARPRLSRGSFLLEMQASAVAGVVSDPVSRLQAMVAIIGTDAAITDTSIIPLYRACRGDALERPQRREHCRTAARQLLAASGDLMEASLAQALADRLDVPPEQQRYSGAMLKAASTAFQEHAIGVVGYSCAAMAAMVDLSARRAAQGELALALGLSTSAPPP